MCLLVRSQHKFSPFELDWELFIEDGDLNQLLLFNFILYL